MEAVANNSSGPVAGNGAAGTPAPAAASRATRIEELGRIILAYSDVTDKLQRSQARLEQTVQSLRNELSEKNRQLELKNRLAALGEMAAGMAHEIRNPLGGIQLYASMLAKDVADQPECALLVKKIANGAKRLEAIVSQVLHFTREIQANPVETDLADVVDQAVELASDRILASGVQCTSQGPRPLKARVDPLLMGQAILNLVLNSVEAMNSAESSPANAGGTIDIAWAPAEESGRCRLSIRDNGPGIPAAVLDRIFNPFFTTKETGTGLGLAIVHRIVEAHDGVIAVSNSPQGGAIFEIRV
jgi:two-component system sensor histidine kinase HydH